MALLTVLNPNSDNRTSFSYEDYTVDFDQPPELGMSPTEPTSSTRSWIAPSGSTLRSIPTMSWAR